MLTVLAAGVTLSACTPRPDGPTPAAEQFFADLSKGDTAGAAQLSDRPSDAQAALNQAWSGLQATHLDTQILGSRFTGDTGSVNYRFTWQLPKKRTWTYDGVLNMIRDEGDGTSGGPRAACTQSSASTRPSRYGPTRRAGPRSTRWAAPTFWCPATCTTTSWTRRRPAGS